MIKEVKEGRDENESILIIIIIYCIGGERGGVYTTTVWKWTVGGG
jgi:hypothetical protein